MVVVVFFLLKCRVVIIPTLCPTLMLNVIKNILPCKTPKIVTWRTAASVTLRTCILMTPVVSQLNASHWNRVWIACTPCFYSNHVSSTAVKSNVTPITNQPPDSIRTWWSDSSTLRAASLNSSCAQPQDQPLGRCWDANDRTRSEQKAVVLTANPSDQHMHGPMLRVPASRTDVHTRGLTLVWADVSCSDRMGWEWAWHKVAVYSRPNGLRRLYLPGTSALRGSTPVYILIGLHLTI